MIYITEDERSSKESERQAEISARKSIATDHRRLSCDINRDSTDENKHDVDRYSLTKADTKIDNKHELSKIRRGYRDNSASNSQRLDTQKRSKIKAAQDISTVEAKVNERNTRTDEDESKSSLHSDLLIRVIEDSYSRKQENVNKTTQSRHVHVEAKSLLE
jgi:hypothetical protein